MENLHSMISPRHHGLSLVSTHFILKYFITTMIQCLSILQIMAMCYHKMYCQPKEAQNIKKDLVGTVLRPYIIVALRQRTFLSANI